MHNQFIHYNIQKQPEEEDSVFDYLNSSTFPVTSQLTPEACFTFEHLTPTNSYNSMPQLTPDNCYTSGSNGLIGQNPDLTMTPLVNVSTPIPLFIYQEATPPHGHPYKQLMFDELVSLSFFFFMLHFMLIWFIFFNTGAFIATCITHDPPHHESLFF
jgi:hypothetical protein